VCLHQIKRHATTRMLTLRFRLSKICYLNETLFFPAALFPGTGSSPFEEGSKRFTVIGNYTYHYRVKDEENILIQ
jgi:hypothetical protein